MPTIVSAATCIFMPKCQVFPFLPLAISGSRFPLLFFVELGASMKIASMIRPLQNLKPASLIRSLIVLKICSPMLCFSSKCRNWRIVGSSGVRPWKRRQRLVTGETLGSAFAPSSSVTGNAAEAALPVDLAFSRARGFGPLLSAQFRAYDSSTFLVIGICRSVILTG